MVLLCIYWRCPPEQRWSSMSQHSPNRGGHLQVVGSDHFHQSWTKKFNLDAETDKMCPAELIKRKDYSKSKWSWSDMLVKGGNNRSLGRMWWCSSWCVVHALGRLPPTWRAIMKKGPTQQKNSGTRRGELSSRQRDFCYHLLPTYPSTTTLISGERHWHRRKAITFVPSHWWVDRPSPMGPL